MTNHGTNVTNGKNDNANRGKHDSHASHNSHPAPPPERLLPPRGDYQPLLSFQKAEVIYDITFRFAHKYLARSDRTIDQMIQSARSGKKNILEGIKKEALFLEQGGLRERMTRARIAYRNGK